MSTSPAPTFKLGVMAKYWTPGAVKTRLGESVGMHVAAQLHRVFCLHLARTLDGFAAEQSFVVTPQEHETDFAQAIGSWKTERQADGDLGQRMRAWFSAEPVAARRHRVLIGADCPLVSPQILAEVERLLGQHDIVFGPARDGGYYLIGLRSPWREAYQTLMTDIPWSSERVLELSCERAAAAGLSVGKLSEMEDVDTIAELTRLREQLAASDEIPHVQLRAEIESVLAEEAS
ncbi:MAG: TIGR04282 family arsenosugar biosynthesis glycosyltransferase [Planctomycetota bacterium]